MAQDGSGPKDSPPASPQALFDGLSQASGKFAQEVFAALADRQRTETAEMLKSLTAGLQNDAGRCAEIQQRYYQQHLQLWQNLAQAGEGVPAPEPVAKPEKTDPASMRPNGGSCLTLIT